MVFSLLSKSPIFLKFAANFNDMKSSHLSYRTSNPALNINTFKNISSSIIEALNANKMTIEDIDWFVPHQANSRILEAVAKKIGIKKDKIIVTVDKHANTSAASIPLALNEAVYNNNISKGDIVLLAAMGGGFTWGSSLIRW